MLIVYGRVTPKIRRYPFVHLGGQKPPCGVKCLNCARTQHNVPGQGSNPESSALTIMPLRLHKEIVLKILFRPRKANTFSPGGESNNNRRPAKNHLTSVCRWDFVYTDVKFSEKSRQRNPRYSCALVSKYLSLPRGKVKNTEEKYVPLKLDIPIFSWTENPRRYFQPYF